ncbi:MAG: hypothetical protein ACFB0E_17030 [Leptolyngbyaceae cyanobacterium]
MTQPVHCHNCGETKLKRIRVRGIKKCGRCGSLVDTRRRVWWRRILPA